jgi:ribosome-associated toxin RatA of RatAB toxin-antitoxin module
MSVRPCLAALCCLGLLAGGLSPARAGTGPDAQAAFTPGERARLLRGELVERRSSREHGGMRLMGGASWQLIDSPPEVVWQALLDTPRYPRFLPQVEEARLVSQSGAKRKVFVRHGGLAAASYYVSLQVENPLRDIRFKIEQGGAIGVRAAWGFYNLRPHGDGTLLAFGIMADIGDGLLTALVRPQVHEWMMKVPWMVKRFVEGSGRALYKRHAAPQATAPTAARRDG